MGCNLKWTPGLMRKICLCYQCHPKHDGRISYVAPHQPTTDNWEINGHVSSVTVEFAVRWAWVSTAWKKGSCMNEQILSGAKDATTWLQIIDIWDIVVHAIIIVWNNSSLIYAVHFFSGLDECTVISNSWASPALPLPEKESPGLILKDNKKASVIIFVVPGSW